MKNLGALFRNASLRVAQVIVRRGDCVLAGVNARTDLLSLPGGKIDAGESPRAGAARELKEEVGIDMPESDLTLFKIQKVRGHSGRPILIYLYEAAMPPNTSPTVKNDPDQEFKRTAWVNPAYVTPGACHHGTSSLLLAVPSSLAKSDLPPSPPAHVRSISPSEKSIFDAVAAIESSGHTQRIHNMVPSGVHKGTRAVSSYGLMPTTLVVVAQKYKPFKASKEGRFILHAADTHDSKEHLGKIINNFTENQSADNAAMRHVWEYKKSRITPHLTSLDHQLPVTALSHNIGINGALRFYKEGGIDSVMAHPYVSKFYGALGKIETSTPKGQKADAT